MNRVKNWMSRWRMFREGQAQGKLETLLFNAPMHTNRHRQKREWALQVCDWIHGRIDDSSAERVAILLAFLKRSENLRNAFTETLRALLMESNATDLLVTTGVPNQSGILTELVERLHFKLLPQAPNERDLAGFMSQAVSRMGDENWFDEVTYEQFSDFHNLIASQELSAHFQTHIDDAIVLLSLQICAAGLTLPIRERLSESQLRKVAFFHLESKARAWLAAESHPGSEQELKDALAACESAIQDVYAHLNEYGVSVSIVYTLDRMERQLTRLRTLIALRSSGGDAAKQALYRLLSSLVHDVHGSHSIRVLLAENLSLLFRKISDRSAQTGEHYITRNRQELIQFFKSALGGGFLTGFTTFAKYLIIMLPFALFPIGFLASLNYAISFVAIQLMGFTLATKQPAMTATALAARMERLNDAQGLQKLIDEIVHLFRSQLIAVVGNLLAVAPTVAALDLLFRGIFFRPLLDHHHALESLHSVSVLSLAPAYAAFTGVLLFASSQVGGWIDNWWAFRKMGPALKANRTLQFVFGERGAASISLYLSRVIGGVAGNISLGLFLGLLPAIFKFVGIPLDIRHVTLSTGMISASVMSLGYVAFQSSDFWLAVIGVLTIGTLNIAGSFACSMIVALKAREVTAPDRSRIYRELWHRLSKHPREFFWI